jgi:hypothetical protein
VELRWLYPDRDPCTADMAPTTTEMGLPDGISSAESLTVHVGDGEAVVLPRAPD